MVSEYEGKRAIELMKVEENKRAELKELREVLKDKLLELASNEKCKQKKLR